ncbi:ABC transporter ATP-binding protein [Lacibacterium aquatile]|uniref:ABC transporter ATP-binding protein n=1 Tax=Lacibacterium aquatile TaxID=1168082 RepID=A0ABW5DSI3_9PROT
MATLVVEDLQTHFFTKKGVVKSVDGVSFTVDKGEILGLVGESGSGKSITGFSILGLLDDPGRVVGGRILFQGQDLAKLPEKDMRAYRGKRIAMIFQDPMMTLNPVLSIETQMVETLQAHENISRKDAKARARDTLGMVGIPSPDERLASYPHQFSGGMRQRVAIAIALLHRPELIIADEPTTALDVTIQSQILYEMQRLTKEFGMALIWISHDLGVVAGLADKVAVMYAGSIVESGTVDEVLDRPVHPYTIGLMGAIPANLPRGSLLRPIPGMAPPPLMRPSGCSFRERCPAATEVCASPLTTDALGTHTWRCFHPQNAHPDNGRAA